MRIKRLLTVSKLAFIFLLLLRPLAGTHVFIFEEDILDKKQEAQLFDLIMRGEPPRAFYNSEPFDLKAECLKRFPTLRLEWVSPLVWQIAALHAFFHDEEIRNGILACAGPWWGLLEYEEELHLQLATASSLAEIVECFDQKTRSLPSLSDLFFRVNCAVAALYHRASGSDREMLSLALAELPPFSQWQGLQFPFWNTPWIYNPNSAQIFYNALKDEASLDELLKIEHLAHEKGEWVLYRGYSDFGYPSTRELGSAESHALSFGSTLLGGTFFALEATALTYSKPDAERVHSFLALRVTPEELKDLFRIGPLHPFVQMLANGEMFHAHTKIAASHPDEYRNKPLQGYFMEANRHCSDPLGYVLSFKRTQEELEKAFLALCEKSGHVFSTEF